MELSSDKLVSLLHSKGYLPMKWYVIKKKLAYVDVLSSISGEMILVYVPNKYSIRCTKGYNLKYVNLSTGVKLVESYAGDPDDLDIEYRYEAVSPTVEKGKMASYLESAYKRPVTLEKTDNAELRNVWRQVNRLKYCVQSIPYKIGVFYKNYLCTVSPSGDVYPLMIENHSSDAKYKLRVIANLETFVHHTSVLEDEVARVKDGVVRVIEKNRLQHQRLVGTLLGESVKVPIEPVIKLKKYTKIKCEFTDRLIKLQDTSDTVTRSIKETKIQNGNSTISSDMNLLGKLQELEAKNERLDITRRTLVSNISKIDDALSNIILSMDAIFFDNIVMLEAVVSNFSQLSNLS
jgi:hypothetical protein